jgi:predicted Zn-dependent protease with MMP-like domain
MAGKRYANPVRIPPEEFDSLVEQALDGLPEEFADLLDNVAVMVEEEPDPAVIESLGLDPSRSTLLGLYQGVPQPRRDTYYSALPDRVTIYRGPILRHCRDRRDIIRQVRDTVVHELGHHFGLGDGEMPY